MTVDELDALAELCAEASEGPLTMTATGQLYIVSLSGQHNNISDEMLVWDAEAYIALRAAAPALLAAANREQKLRKAITEYLEWGAMTGSDRDLLEDQFREALKGTP